MKRTYIMQLDDEQAAMVRTITAISELNPDFNWIDVQMTIDRGADISGYKFLIRLTDGQMLMYEACADPDREDRFIFVPDRILSEKLPFKKDTFDLNKWLNTTFRDMLPKTLNEVAECIFIPTEWNVFGTNFYSATNPKEKRWSCFTDAESRMRNQEYWLASQNRRHEEAACFVKMDGSPSTFSKINRCGVLPCFSIRRKVWNT